MPDRTRKSNDGLTMKQRKFVNAYCESGNASQSALKAGYSENSAESQGSRLLKNPKVIKAIELKEKEFEMASLITKEYVLAALKDIADDEGEQTQNKLRALENLGKYLTMFTDKQIIQNDNGNPFEQLSDAEIIKMYEEQKRFKKQA